ncbi:MAG: hypothetical protein ACE5GX_11550 [Thermoanaerobaculia bacterium]
MQHSKLPLIWMLVILAATALRAEEQIVPLAPDARLELVVPNTAVEVKGTDGSTLRLEGVRSRFVEVEDRGGVVTVQVSPDTGQHQPAALSLELPWGHDLHVIAERRQVAVEDVRGTVTVQQGSAPVTLDRIVGDVDVFNRSHRIWMGNIDGEVRAESQSHEVRVTNVTGSVWGRSVTGPVTVENAAGKRVDLASVNGTVSYRGTVRADGWLSLNSNAGEVLIELPLESNVTIALGGDVNSFDVEGATLKETGIASAQVQLGDGRGRIELYSFRGAVRVRAVD